MKLALPAATRQLVGHAVLPGVDVAWYAGDDIRAAASDADVLWRHLGPSPSPAELDVVLHQADRLKWLHVSQTGVDTLPLATIASRRVAFTNGAGIQSPPIAEHVIMCMLAARRNLPPLLRAQASSRWTPELGGDAELDGAHAVILGFGHIGRAIARLSGALGVDVVGVRRRASTEPGVIGDESWRELLSRTDFLIVALPLTRSTLGLVGQRELMAMRSGAWLINVGRGSVVDETALLQALTSGHLGGAALDAPPREPLPPDHPIWALPNVILTPHIAYRSNRTEERAARLFLDNLSRFRDGASLLNVVDPVAGY